MNNNYYVHITYEVVDNLAISLSPEVYVLDLPFEDRVKIVVEHLKKCNVMLIDQITTMTSNVLRIVNLRITCNLRELQRMKLLYGSPYIQFNTDADGNNVQFLKLTINKL